MIRFSIFLLLIVSGGGLASAPDQAEPRLKSFEWMSVEEWFQYHEDDKAIAEQGRANLLFLGDSITQGWDWEIWQKTFAPHGAANFGIGGDKTENVLWRIQNGGVGKLNPALIVLMIGVNNFGHDNDSAEDVALGVHKILEEISSHWPQTDVLVLGILPYGEKHEKFNRDRVTQSNKLLADIAKDFSYRFEDFGAAFLDRNKNIPTTLMADLLHPTAEGYQILANKLAPIVDEILSTKNNRKTLGQAVKDAEVVIEGRYREKDDHSVDIGFPGVSVHFNFEGNKLNLYASSSSGKNLVDIYLNGKHHNTLEIKNKPQAYTLIEEKKEKVWRVELVHRSESWHGILNLEALEPAAGKLLSPPGLPSRKILILGDSITCGEAVYRKRHCEKDFYWWDPENSYGKLIGEKLDTQVHLVCHGGRGLLRSWNGKTDEANVGDYLHFALSTGKDSPIWNHAQYQADLVLINIGTNDFSEHAGAFPNNLAVTQAWLTLFGEVQDAYPSAKIAVTEGPMLEGEARNAIRESLQKAITLSSKDIKHLDLKVRKGNSCDAHPTAREHKAMAKSLSKQVRAYMNW